MHNDFSKSFQSLLSLVLVVLGGLFLSNFFALALALPLVGFDLGVLFQLLEKPNADATNRPIFTFVQGVSSAGTFIVVPYLFYRFYAKDILGEFTLKFSVQLFVLAALMVLVAMPLVAWIVKWNETIQLPEYLSAFEIWAKKKEKLLRELTLFLVDFESPKEFFVGLFVIALIPALGEELLFRGILQNLLHKIIGNITWAILLTGFIFSAFHLQFYGLIPRMLLGILFGYLYFWSSNLAVPILAHFVNNGFTLLMMYLHKLEIVEIDIDSPVPPPTIFVLASVALLALLTWFFQKKCRAEALYK